MKELKFRISPESTAGIGDGDANGTNPLKELIQAQSEFVNKFSWMPEWFMVNPTDAEKLSKNEGVLLAGNGKFVDDDGTFAACKWLKLRESTELEAGFAVIGVDT